MDQAAPLTKETSPQEAPESRAGRVPVLVWVIAAVFVALELALSGWPHLRHYD